LNLPGVVFSPEMKQGFIEMGKFWTEAASSMWDTLNENDTKKKLAEIQSSLAPLANLTKLFSFDPRSLKAAGAEYSDTLKKVTQQGQEATSVLLQWATDVPNRIQKLYPDMVGSKEDALALLEEGAKTTELLGKLYDAFGDVNEMSTYQGDWAQDLPIIVKQAKDATGAAHNWMVGIPQETRSLLKEEALVATDLSALYKLFDLGTDKMPTATEAALATAALPANIQLQKDMIAGAASLMEGLDSDTRALYAEYAVTSGHFKSLIDLVTTAPDVDAPQRGWKNRLIENVSALGEVTDIAMPELMRIHTEYGADLVIAQQTVSAQAGLWKGIGELAQSIQATADIGGINVGNAQAIMAQLETVNGGTQGSTASSIADYGAGGSGNLPQGVSIAMDAFTNALNGFTSNGITITVLTGGDADGKGATMTIQENTDLVEGIHVVAGLGGFSG